MEEWKSVLGYEGLYEVSNTGNVRSVPRVSVRTKNSTRWLKGKMLSSCQHNYGYREYKLSKGAIKRARFAHILVLEAFVCPRPIGMQGCHNDGNPLNNCLDNLRWDTPKNNQADRVKHGTRQVGEDWCRSILTEGQVIHIRNSELSCKHLGEMYGVHMSTIHLVRKRKNWKHVP